MKIVHKLIVLITVLLLFFWINAAFPWETSIEDMPVEVNPLPQIAYNFTQKDRDYQETQLRRFEIIFFISLPASFLFSFLGFTAYRWASGRSGSFTPMEYQYLILSTIGTSLTIAIHDNKMTYRKRIY